MFSCYFSYSPEKKNSKKNRIYDLGFTPIIILENKNK